MGSIAEDIAVTRTHVEYLRAWVEKQDAATKVQDDAIAELKSARKTDRAVNLALGAAAAFVFTHADKITKVLALLTAMCLMTSCVSAGYSWKLLPTVAIDTSMEQDCVDASTEAVKFWEYQGVNYLTTKLVAPPWDGFERGNLLITVQQKDTVHDYVAGETEVAVFEGDETAIARAEIRLKSCDPGVMRHELGHALGLDDVGYEYDYKRFMGRTMCFWVGCIGLEVTDEERAHVVW